MFHLTILVSQLFLLYLLSRQLHQRIGQFFLHITKSKKWTTHLLAILFLPGTFIHELSHFLTALVLLVPVGQPELTPEILKDNKIKLGSVPIGKTDPFRRFAIGIAPVIFGLASMFALLSYTLSHNLLQTPLYLLLTGYIIFTLGNTMFSSRKDLQEAWKLLVILLILAVVYYLLHLPIPDLRQLALPTQATEILRQTIIFLTVPIAIDIVILAAARKL